MLSDELLFLYLAKIDSKVYLCVPGPLSISLFVEVPNNDAEALPLLLLLLLLVVVVWLELLLLLLLVP